jgi:hypothetical protein
MQSSIQCAITISIFWVIIFQNSLINQSKLHSVIGELKWIAIMSKIIKRIEIQAIM